MENINLKEMLSKEYLLKDGVSGLKNKFDEIAKILLTQTKIVKDSQEYYITDIEFYLYCQGHEDIITYPRNCDAGMWFFHNSGVDISFKSENIEFRDSGSALRAVYPNDETFFGGILLRGIKLTNSNYYKGLTGKDLNNHPQNICDELFDKFNALEPITANDYPHLVILDKPHCEFDKENIERFNLISNDISITNKVQNICSSNYYGGKSIYQTKFDEYFKEHLKKPYRYTLKEVNNA